MAAAAPKIGGEYGDVRANIDIDALNVYFYRHAPTITTPVSVKQFKFGQSNPTYFLNDASNTRFVLRKKPAGQLLSSTAHQIEREHTMLQALYNYNIRPTTPPDRRIPVPKPILLCEDKSVIGTPFYVMEYLEGRIFTNPRMPEVSAHDKRECWLSAVRALAALSFVDPANVGLSNFGPQTDYFPRQMKSLSRISSAQAAIVDVETGKPTGDVPFFHELIAWYTENLPNEKKFGIRIVHGDYKIDNLIFHPTENRVIGILDWELCTLGHPLADLGNFVLPWSMGPNDLPRHLWTTISAFRGVTDDIPIPLEDLEREYCKLIDQPYPIPEMTFVRSWMLFRLSVIAQGIAARLARRQASSEQAYLYADGFPIIGKLAKVVLDREGLSLNTVAKL